jgi:hypothetical protein
MVIIATARTKSILISTVSYETFSLLGSQDLLVILWSATDRGVLKGDNTSAAEILNTQLYVIYGLTLEERLTTSKNKLFRPGLGVRLA